MEFVFLEKEMLDAAEDTAVMFLYEGEQNDIVPAPAFEDFKGKDGQTVVCYPQSSPKRLILSGLGKRENFHINKLRLSVANVINTCRKLEVATISFSTVKDGVNEKEAIVAITESALMADHKFVMKSEASPSKINRIILFSSSPKALEKDLFYAVVTARNCNAVRDLVNNSASTVTPTYIAKVAEDLCEQKGIKCTVYSRKELKEMGANALLAVASGSCEEPKMVVMEYTPKSFTRTVALVGKGITFDSGGLSLKPAAGMETMKCDMAGAVSVMHTLIAAAELKINVRIIGVMALTENIIGPGAYKPGDIIKTMSGKTIEILNTDAEGRVVLSDALHLAGTFSPDYTIDVATLTGACIVALGTEVSGIMGNDAELIEAIKKSGLATYERVWELPMYEEYKELTVSEFADLKNVTSNAPGSPAGAIVGAKFLEQFVKGKWAHLDIAGTDWADAEKGYKPKGATGVGVRLLTHFLYNVR